MKRGHFEISPLTVWIPRTCAIDNNDLLQQHYSGLYASPAFPDLWQPSKMNIVQFSCALSTRGHGRRKHYKSGGIWIEEHLGRVSGSNNEHLVRG